jgi:hypothetical protein
MPYLRPSLAEGKADVLTTGGDAPVLKDLANGLLVSYVVDTGDHLKYIQQGHLQDYNMRESDLDDLACRNLTVPCEDKASGRAARQDICDVSRRQFRGESYPTRGILE